MDSPDISVPEPNAVIPLTTRISTEGGIALDLYNYGAAQNVLGRTKYTGYYLDMRNEGMNGKYFMSDGRSLYRIVPATALPDQNAPVVFASIIGEQLSTLSDIHTALAQKTSHGKTLPVTFLPNRNELAITLEQQKPLNIRTGFGAGTHRNTESIVILSLALQNKERTGESEYLVHTISELSPPNCVSLDIFAAPSGQILINATELSLGTELTQLLSSIGIQTIDKVENSSEGYFQQMVGRLADTLGIPALNTLRQDRGLMAEWFIATFRANEEGEVFDKSRTGDKYQVIFAPSIGGMQTSFNEATGELITLYEELAGRTENPADDFWVNAECQLEALGPEGSRRAAMSFTGKDKTHVLIIGQNHDDLYRFAKAKYPDLTPDLDFDVLLKCNFPALSEPLSFSRRMINEQPSKAYLPTLPIEITVTDFKGKALSPGNPAGYPDPEDAARGQILITDLIEAQHQARASNSQTVTITIAAPEV